MWFRLALGPRERTRARRRLGRHRRALHKRPLGDKNINQLGKNERKLWVHQRPRCGLVTEPNRFGRHKWQPHWRPIDNAGDQPTDVIELGLVYRTLISLILAAVDHGLLLQLLLMK